jgi:hypothetical protein
MFKKFALALIVSVTLAQQAPAEDPMAQFNCQTENDYNTDMMTYIMGGGDS